MANRKTSKRLTSSSVTYKGKPYTGILAEPAHVCMLAHNLDPGCPPQWFNGSQDEWARLLERAMEFHRAHFMRCLGALADHYRVTLNDQAEGWQELAIALATEHVPAFQTGHLYARMRSRRVTSRGQPTRLGVVDTFRMLSDAAELIHGEIDAGRKRPSNRNLGKQLANREWAKRCDLKAATIRKLLSDVKDSWQAIASRRATEFQRQFVEVLIPIIHDELSGRSE